MSAQPRFTTQQVATIRCLGAIVRTFDHHRARYIELQQRIALAPDGAAPAALLRDAEVAGRDLAQATLDMRDAAAHLCSLLPAPPRRRGD